MPVVEPQRERAEGRVPDRSNKQAWKFTSLGKHRFVDLGHSANTQRGRERDQVQDSTADQLGPWGKWEKADPWEETRPDGNRDRDSCPLPRDKEAKKGTDCTHQETRHREAVLQSKAEPTRRACHSRSLRNVERKGTGDAGGPGSQTDRKK